MDFCYATLSVDMDHRGSLKSLENLRNELFASSRYGFKKISSKNINFSKSYGLPKLVLFFIPSIVAQPWISVHSLAGGFLWRFFLSRMHHSIPNFQQVFGNSVRQSKPAGPRPEFVTPGAVEAVARAFTATLWKRGRDLWNLS